MYRWMVLVFLFVATASVGHTASSRAVAPADNGRLAAVFDADQQDRRPAPGRATDWTNLSLADDGRRTEVRAMLAAGMVRSGMDYYHAAFVFQHGDEPRDYLLAHTLAITAIAKGQPIAGWIAAATLDRYLGAVGQPQIYGTQYRTKRDHPTTQEPYDRTLLDDEQRRAVTVETLAEQATRLAAMNRTTASSTKR